MNIVTKIAIVVLSVSLFASGIILLSAFNYLFAVVKGVM